ncbi:hypothetical protein FJY71_09965, partial [candidate division WOR-3 bacterium]|nr:hypothetical protein [candidate division WOR-3 bacterium]
MRAGVLLVVLSAAATTAAVRWTSTFGLSCRYCDNLFQLSPGDLESFRRSESPDRFPYRTSDDLDVTLTGALAGSFSRAGRIE